MSSGMTVGCAATTRSTGFKEESDFGSQDEAGDDSMSFWTHILDFSQLSHCDHLLLRFQANRRVFLSFLFTTHPTRLNARFAVHLQAKIIVVFGLQYVLACSPTCPPEIGVHNQQMALQSMANASIAKHLFATHVVSDHTTKAEFQKFRLYHLPKINQGVHRYMA